MAFVHRMKQKYMFTYAGFVSCGCIFYAAIEAWKRPFHEDVAQVTRSKRFQGFNKMERQIEFLFFTNKSI